MASDSVNVPMECRLCGDPVKTLNLLTPREYEYTELDMCMLYELHGGDEDYFLCDNCRHSLSQISKSIQLVRSSRVISEMNNTTGCLMCGSNSGLHYFGIDHGPIGNEVFSRMIARYGRFNKWTPIICEACDEVFSDLVELHTVLQGHLQRKRAEPSTGQRSAPILAPESTEKSTKRDVQESIAYDAVRCSSDFLIFPLSGSNTSPELNFGLPFPPGEIKWNTSITPRDEPVSSSFEQTLSTIAEQLKGTKPVFCIGSESSEDTLGCSPKFGTMKEPVVSTSTGNTSIVKEPIRSTKPSYDETFEFTNIKEPAASIREENMSTNECQLRRNKPIFCIGSDSSDESVEYDQEFAKGDEAVAPTYKDNISANEEQLKRTKPIFVIGSGSSDESLEQFQQSQTDITFEITLSSPSLLIDRKHANFQQNISKDLYIDGAKSLDMAQRSPLCNKNEDFWFEEDVSQYMPRSLYIDDNDSLPKFPRDQLAPMHGEEKSQINFNEKSVEHEDVISCINKGAGDHSEVDSIDQLLRLNDELSATCTPVPDSSENAQLFKIPNKKEDYRFEEDVTQCMPRSLFIGDNDSLPKFSRDQLAPMHGEEKSQIDFNEKDVMSYRMSTDLHIDFTDSSENAQLSKTPNKKEDYRYEEDITQYMPRSLFIDDSDSLPKFVPMSGEEKSQIDINAKSGKHEDVIKPINKDGRDRTVVDSIDQFLSLNDDLSATCTPVPESAQLSKMTNKKEDYQFEEDRTRYIPRSLLMDDDYSLPRFPTDQLSNTPVKDVPQTELGKETEEPEDVINSDTQDLSGLNRFNEFLHLNDDLFATLKSVLAKAVTPFIPRTLYTGCTDSSHDVPNKKEDCRFEKDITIPRNLFNDDDDSLPGPSDQLSNTPGGDNPQTDLDGNEEQEDTEDRSGIDLFNELLHFNENLFAMHTSFPARSVTPFIPRTFYTDYTDNSDEMTNEKEGYRFEEDITQCMPRSLVITDDNSLPSFSGDQLFNKSGKDNPQTVLDEEIAVQGEGEIDITVQAAGLTDTGVGRPVPKRAAPNLSETAQVSTDMKVYSGMNVTEFNKPPSAMAIANDKDEVP